MALICSRCKQSMESGNICSCRSCRSYVCGACYSQTGGICESCSGEMNYMQ